MLGTVEETESFVLKLPYSAIRDKVSIYERVSIVHDKYYTAQTIWCRHSEKSMGRSSFFQEGFLEEVGLSR